MIPTVEETISQYVAAWNLKGYDEMKAGFAKCWAIDGNYTDPSYALVEGLEGITKLAHDSYEQLPVRTFSVLTQPQHHHNAGSYRWGVEKPEGESGAGLDYFEFNDENKITRLVSFF